LHPVGFTVPAPLPRPRCALAAPFRPYRAETRRYPFCGTVPDTPSPELMAHRRALPGTAVPWSPDFPRWSKLHRGRPALWRGRYRAGTCVVPVSLSSRPDYRFCGEWGPGTGRTVGSRTV